MKRYADGQMEQSTFFRYGVSLLATTLTFLFWYALAKRIGVSPYPLLLLAVMVSSWYGGQAPGLLATALGLGAAALLYGPPFGPDNTLQLGLLLLLALPICFLNQERRQLLQQEQRARAQVERLAAERSAMLGQMTEAVIIVDTEERITFMNAAAQRLLGIESWEGMSIATLTEMTQVSWPDGTDIVPEEALLARVLAGAPEVRAERIVQRPDGKRLVVQIGAASVVSPDGRELGAVATIHDVTAERLLEQEKAAIAAGIAHDLKNPLAAIKGTAQLLLRNAAGKEVSGARAGAGVIEGLRSIDASATRMSTLIHDLLEAGPEASGNAGEDPVDLVAVVRRAAHIYQQATETHVIHVCARTPHVTALWDEGRLERIVGNLLSNAIKYSPDGGGIQVMVDREAEGPDAVAVLVVADQGLGIPANERESIFGHRQRGSNVLGQIPGTGLGLAATRQLIEQYGGTISVASELSRGAVFTVRLPLRMRPSHAEEGKLSNARRRRVI